MLSVASLSYTMQKRPSRAKEIVLCCNGNKKFNFPNKEPSKERVLLEECRVQTFVSILHRYIEMLGFWTVEKLV
jgi:hypothetical protein